MVGDGAKCSRTDPCESSPCFPGTVCIPLHDKGTYECGPCPDGLIGTGKSCRPPFHPCESNPCYLGVACGEKDDGFECGPCPAGTIGDGIMCKGEEILDSVKSFFLNGPIPVSFCPFLTTISIIQIVKSLDAVLGSRTCGRKMVGADKTTELWRPLHVNSIINLFWRKSGFSPN